VVLTAAERRGGVIVVLLLALGAAHDLWRAAAPPAAEVPARAAIGADHAATDVTSAAPAPPAGPSAPEPPLDLNRADARALDMLPGVGPVLAGRIVEQRRRYGPFRRVEDLLAVRGVGPRLLARLGGRVAVAPAGIAHGDPPQGHPAAPPACTLHAAAPEGPHISHQAPGPGNR
jgi:competence ComEA-like helix-hairpin-helix protein